MAEKPHLSVSQLEMLQKCPKQWEWRYAHGIKIPPGAAAIRGRATHSSIEKNLEHKREHKELLPLDTVQEIAADAVNREWTESGVYLTAEEKEFGAEQAIRGDTVDTAVALAGTHHGDLAPAIEPVHLERKFELALEGFDYDLLGYIDIQTPDGVIDTKTASKSPAANDANLSTQLTAYSLAVAHLDTRDHGGEVRPPERLEVHYLVATKKPKSVVQATARDHRDWATFLDRLEMAAKLIQSGVFMPCQEGAWCCCEKWCGYWRDLCFYGRRGRSRARAE